ncbi:MAG: hypothetical protein LVQ95_04330 [Candidatus Micrarchaeales archaeon]|nr:hypothetical protein [Candidatus Micrarchaeales archaeon]
MLVNLTNSSKEKVHDKNLVGGKGYALLLLEKYGMKVPKGFILTTEEFQRFLSENQLSIPQSGNSIDTILRGAKLPERLVREIRSHLDSSGLGSVPLAVRSSANVEDAAVASFAGQFTTVLNVTGEKALLKAIKAVYTSVFDKKIIDYCNSFSVPITSIGMAVVVQELIHGEVSGVMFTRDPITGKPDIVIEAVVGLNEGLVSGHLTPSRFVVDAERSRISESQIREQSKSYAPENGGVVVKSNNIRIEDVLKEDKILELASKGVTLQKLFGSAQDIEWTMKGDVIYLLQSRPITTLARNTTSSSKHRSGKALIGYPGSSGTAEGEIEIIGSPDAVVAPGKILVFESTDTEFVPLMKKAKAIITNEGGMLSHAAVVSRELNIPAVVGVKDATKLLKDGQRVFVDGGAGVVSLEGRLNVKVKGKEYDMSTLYCLDTMLETKIDGNPVYYEVLPDKVVYYTGAKITKSEVDKHLRSMGFEQKAKKGGEDKFYIRKRWETYKQDPVIESFYQRISGLRSIDTRELLSLVDDLVVFGKENMKQANAITDDSEAGLLKSLLHLRRTAISYLLLNTVLCEGYGLRVLHTYATPILEKQGITFSEFLSKIEFGEKAFASTDPEDVKSLNRLIAYYKIISEWRQKTYSIFFEFGGYSEQVATREKVIIGKLNQITKKEGNLEYWYLVAVKSREQ